MPVRSPLRAWMGSGGGSALLRSARRPPPIAHRRRGGGGGPAAESGGGGEGKREGEGAALTRGLPRNDLRVAFLDAAISWQPYRDWTPMWSAPCPHSTEGETEAQKVSGYSDIDGHSWLHRLTLGWWVLGELETQVLLQAPTCSFPPLLLLCPPPVEKHSSSWGLVPFCPGIPGDTFLPAPAADLLLLSSRTPDPLTPDQSFSTLFWELMNPSSALIELN